MKSSFRKDLEKEKRLSQLLDSYYTKHLKQYTFNRVLDKKEQLAGVDIMFRHKKRGRSYPIDEKAQLDYVNERLSTFAFELYYEKNSELKPGWFFDAEKKTEFYALVTSIFSDNPGQYTSCDITFVNRKKLITALEKKLVSAEKLKKLILPNLGFHGKMHLEALDPKFEGYVYFSSKNKKEKPVNLVLYLDFLHQIEVAKRLI
ncbi:hypothetical protein [Flagellimonas allohymeniacidonis]|uniref:Uncharacterized protein n=1 Tax=Flagellimonas allohymeniacidonis TaxID=2517819 RepID=A0A4Q8QGR8_9FLAO|nr:hypothetical protein [Allomuricauda hymeniacidonis]TAI47579.1 hypothetical protein EW142_13000 [Allomuricauda hymeniacidonis]